jgi:ankyrin repeat protein
MLSMRAVLVSLACASIVRRAGEKNPVAFEATPSVRWAGDKFRQTAADHAAKHADFGPKHRKTAKWLVEEKNVLVKAETGAVLLETESQESQEETTDLSPLRWAADKALLAMYMLKGEWFAQTPSGVDAMLYAAKKGYLDTLKWLVENGADVNAKSDVYGEFAVHVAAENGRVDVLEWLKTNGADMDAEDEMFDSQAVHKAVMEGQVEALEWLKDNGADLQAKTSSGRTPAHRAASRGNLAALQWLEKNGANLNAKDGQDETLVHAAAYGFHDGWKDVMTWLVKEKGLDVNAVAKYGGRPVHNAAGFGDQTVVEWLEEHGADLTAKNEFGWTASDKAAQMGQWEMLAWLVDEKDVELGAYSYDPSAAPGRGLEVVLGGEDPSLGQALW